MKFYVFYGNLFFYMDMSKGRGRAGQPEIRFRLFVSHFFFLNKFSNILSEFYTFNKLSVM